jgi:hypothetical protein
VETEALWRRFRAGEAIRCPNSGSSFALSVDAATPAYKIGCSECGMASAWFEVTPNGILERPEPSGGTLGDD